MKFHAERRSADRGVALLDSTLLIACSLCLILSATETIGYGISFRFDYVERTLNGGGTDIIIMTNPNGNGDSSRGKGQQPKASDANTDEAR